MSERVPSETFSVARWFRLGSVPGSPDEVREFVQRRITTFLGFCLSILALTFALVTGLGFITDPREVTDGANGVRSLVHLAAGLTLGGLLWFVRRRRFSERGLLWLDFVGVLVPSVAISAMLASSLPVVRYRPDMSCTLGLVYLLTARAAVIPSSPSRTLVFGGLAFLPLLVATYGLYVAAEAAGVSPNRMYPGDRSTPVLMTAWTGVFCLVGVVTSAFVSFVIFGLHREVARAKKLGQYVLADEIGAGGMGVVFRAQHALLRRPTAVKLLPPERAGHAAIARFEREVQITAELTHPNTVAVYDYGRTPEGVFYYAMEYLDGADLERLVQRHGPQPPARVRHLMRQVAMSLAEAHARGLIHRDVKPSNLVVCRRGLERDFVKVVDFGLARDFEAGRLELTGSGELVGTPFYVSPEQITNPSAVGPASDLYGLGAVAYFLLTGTPPFQGKTVVEVCAGHLHAPVEPPSVRLGAEVPRELERLVLDCLAKDPSERPKDALEFVERLDACSELGAWTVREREMWWSARENGAERGSPEHALE
jgi:hypothetical protein